MHLLKNKNGQRTLECEKAKDAEEYATITMRLAPVAKSCVVRFGSRSLREENERDDILEVLRRVIPQGGSRSANAIIDRYRAVPEKERRKIGTDPLKALLKEASKASDSGIEHTPGQGYWLTLEGGPERGARTGGPELDGPTRASEAPEPSTNPLYAVHSGGPRASGPPGAPRGGLGAALLRERPPYGLGPSNRTSEEADQTVIDYRADLKVKRNGTGPYEVN
jgi:hypothetical protein